MDTELIITSDGSHSLHVPDLNENYHSTHGALQESLHVFIRHGYDYQRTLSTISVLEIGLGTGLNALLTVKAAEEVGKSTFYTAVEAYPLPDNVTRQLNYPVMLDHPQAGAWFARIHSATWGIEELITDKFKLMKVGGRLQTVVLPGNFFDVVYFDAFAPQKQPEMWSRDLFMKVYDTMKEQGCLVTYCARGQVKRDLRAVGFLVESLPGPPGKREMIRATRRKS
jgi:tRNA U34 5-methylaminomethyl-2-thiouridine-forming methyltransferase MnmC